MNIVIITGASGGIGGQFALQLDGTLPAADGFWLIGRNRKKLEALAGKLRHPSRRIALDLAGEDAPGQLGALLESEKPAVRMLINCAGFGRTGSFEKTLLSDQTGQVDVNCRALVGITAVCLPYMRKGSRIIQLASSAGFLPQPGFAVYAATKAFVLSFSRALAQELRKKGIYVTAVCPGPVKTGFLETAGAAGNMLPIKKYTMVPASRVAAKALADSRRKRSVSVCGLPILAFWLLTKVCPHGPLILAVGAMKERKSVP